MGMSIEIHVIDIEKLKKASTKKIKVTEGKMSPSELIDKALPHFGIVHAGLFTVQTADYWDDYCPWYQLQNFFDRYYFTDFYDIFREAQVAWYYDGANADDVASVLDIELGPHPDDEEEDNE